MNRFDEDLDALNEETFGDNDYYDWEAEHEKFMLEQSKEDPFEDSSCANFLHGQFDEDKDRSRNLDGLEASIERLIENDEEYLDPAIVNCLKKPIFKEPQNPLASLGLIPNSPLNKENNKIWNYESPPFAKNKEYETRKINKTQASMALDMIEKFFTMSVDGNGRPIPQPKPSQAPLNMHQRNYPTPISQFSQKPPPSSPLNTNFTPKPQGSANNSPGVMGQYNFSVPPPQFSPKQEFLNNLASPRIPATQQLNQHSTITTPNHNQDIVKGRIPTMPRKYDRIPLEPMAPFDPVTDIWITRLERTYILKIKNIFLQNSTPYIHDYYYSITWLRKITKRKQEIAEMNDSVNTFSPLLAIPPPISVTDLAQENNYHNLESNFVLTEEDREENEEESKKDDDEKKEIPLSGLTLSPLGKVTKSNYRTQRIIAELSVVSAVKKSRKSSKKPKEDLDEESSQRGAPEDETSFNDAATSVTNFGDALNHQEQSLRQHRERTILLAQIERVFSIVLNLDEIDFALVRLTEQNEDFEKLINHKTALLDRLLSNFFLRPANEAELALIGLKRDTKEGSEVVDENLTTGYHVPDLNILSVRKGCRVFLQVLPYLSSYNLQLSFAYFIANFTVISRIVTISLEELSETFYPIFKPLTLRTEDIKRFLELCLPDASEFLIGDQVKAKSAIDFLFTSLGISFVLNLLDLYARQLNASIQSDFINFCVRLMKCLSRSDEDRPLPLESFPTLLNVLPRYLNSALKGTSLSTAGVITNTELNMLISLISSARRGQNTPTETSS